MDTVLVTGCAGYIGSALCDKLSFVSNVIGVDSLYYRQCEVLSSLISIGTEFHNLDIRDTERMLPLIRRADKIIHLAALVGPICSRRPKEAISVNEEATIRLTRAVSKSQEFLYACTNSCYGDSGHVLVNENTLDGEPLSIYAKTKMEGEKAVVDAGGLSLRLATVFGLSPRMRFDLMVNYFVEKITQHGTLEIFEPDCFRNAVGIRDVTTAFMMSRERIRCAFAKITCMKNYSKVLFANPEGNMTKLELAHRICDLLGKPRDIIRIGKGEDPDKRNCKVQSLGQWNFAHSLDEGILEVASLCKSLPCNDGHYPVSQNWRNA